MTTRILKLNNELFVGSTMRNLFMTLSLSLGFVLMLYMYLVGSIIFGVIERKHIETSIREYKSSIAGLETEYPRLAGNITLSRAYELGFKEATNQIFISRKGSLKPITLSGNEI